MVGGGHGQYLLLKILTILVVSNESKGFQDESNTCRKPFTYTSEQPGLSTNSFHNQDRNIWAQARSRNAAEG